jgi:hypothetical protein
MAIPTLANFIASPILVNFTHGALTSKITTAVSDFMVGAIVGHVNGNYFDIRSTAKVKKVH